MEDDGSPKINFGRGLQTGCTVPVSQGMVVRTATDVVTEARESIIEFLLTSHPLTALFVIRVVSARCKT